MSIRKQIRTWGTEVCRTAWSHAFVTSSTVREKGMNYDGPQSSCNVGLCPYHTVCTKQPPASRRWLRMTHRPGADLEESSWEMGLEGLEWLANALLKECHARLGVNDEGSVISLCTGIKLTLCRRVLRWSAAASSPPDCESAVVKYAVKNTHADIFILEPFLLSKIRVSCGAEWPNRAEAGQGS